MKIIHAKMKGQKVEVEEPDAPESTKVIDLMARLQESLEQSKSTHKRKRPAPAPGDAEEQSVAVASKARRGSGNRTRRRRTA